MTILRPIRIEELELVMNWRMMPEITKFMYTDPKLTPDGQLRWFQSLAKRRDMKAFMIETDGEPIGVMNITDIDYVNNRCTWGYYIAIKEKRSLPLALALEWNLYDYVFFNMGMNKLEGEIFSFNKNVLRLHLMCGSEVEGVLKQHIYKNGNYYDVTVTGITRERWQEIKSKYNYEIINFLEE